MRTKVIDQRRQAGYFPYYKLQAYMPHVGAWKDVQRRFKTPEAALAYGRGHLHPKAKETGLRVMVVTRQGREIYQD